MKTHVAHSRRWIPYLDCMATLIAEQSILARTTRDAQSSQTARILPPKIVPPSQRETAAR
ncbi:MAG TPA: hypothetical protein VFN62_04085 [Acidobacteriaceae bacterium]|nr:hypothetical protein [Acidobacteriaceae bacterium]